MELARIFWGTFESEAEDCSTPFLMPRAPRRDPPEISEAIPKFTAPRFWTRFVYNVAK
jgi:hypothetical protein